MRIGFTGGGTGGHFYPLIAVAEEVRSLGTEKGIASLELHYFGPSQYDEKALTDTGLIFHYIPAGKRRGYFSLLNYFDLLKTLWGSIVALFKVFKVYPDVIFSKGGFASVPVVLACRLLLIPVFVHESDSVPGRANKWAGRFAARVALSYAEASEYFDNKNVAYTGQPIRKAVTQPLKEGSYIFFDLDSSISTIFILGGSQGAEIINNTILESLPELLQSYNVIHQAGDRNIQTIAKSTELILENNPFKKRYKVYGFMNNEEMRRAAGIADIIISRAGSTIFEIASWQKPSIIIPITNSVNNHQKRNAFLYAQTDAAAVIGENNLTENILISEITRIMADEKERNEMIQAAKNFHNADAALIIAQEIIEIAMEHE